ncbi:MAG: hypothetical protein GY841_18765 [FCB group bacterium]|nr:hypothetical protein [FCB group bacterium]
MRLNHAVTPGQKPVRRGLRLCPVFLSLIFMLLMGGLPVMAEKASSDEMEQVCQNWLTNIVSLEGDWAGVTTPRIENIREIKEDGLIVARCYDIWPSGYVVVPALKELAPIKAYSIDTSLDIDAPGGMGRLLRDVLQSNLQIFTETYGSLDAVMPASEPLFDPIGRQKWDTFSASTKSFSQSRGQAEINQINGVGPLLTSTWHQGAPYNNLCPEGDGGRTVVGCVATAAAQILQYHQWPPMGTGSHTYNWGGDNSCDGSTPSEQLTADFSDPYSYDGSSAAVAELSYEMGVAYNMDYGYCGSGAYTLQGATIFPQYFMYDESAETQYRDEHSANSWFDMIVDEINQGRPMLYRIYSHAIVLDGWQQVSGLDQYHFNYGWGGSANAWYTVDNLHCPWSGCDPMVEGMVRYIIPKTAMLWLGGNSISDVSGGDGDGIPEGGETIELAITVANYGAEGVSDVSGVLSIDDASITIINGSTYYGPINAHDSADNAADPFVISIPPGYTPRIDSFFLEITWDGGTKIDTLLFEKNIGEVTILLVDDDFKGTADQYYRQTLASFRIPYDVWDSTFWWADNLITPDSALLAQYNIVVWETGEYRSGILSIYDCDVIKGYMNSGGNMMLTGQGIANQIRSTDADLLNNYLKASYSSSVYLPILVGPAAGNISEFGDSLVIQGYGGASNQTYPDNIMPINGGIPEFQYHDRSDYGCVTYSGDFKSVFFSFGFEAIINGDSRWIYRDTVFTRILDFFSYQQPEQCPMVMDVTVSPGNPDNLIDHTPDIAWSYYDQGGAPQALYQVQVGSNVDWTEAEMWDIGPVSGTEQSITYAGDELFDGEKYYIRVRTYNGTFWSNWYEMEIEMNSAPQIPTDLAPDNMAGSSNDTPNLSVTNALDGEYDELFYSWEVYDDAIMTTLITYAVDQPEGYTTSDWTVDVPLSDNQEYFWRVKAGDGYEDGEWSGLASFWVNSANQPPDSAALISPADEGVVINLTATFIWAPSVDSDLHDSVHYTLRYAEHSSFLGQVSIPHIYDTVFTLSNPLDMAIQYYWRITAYDEFGGQTYSATNSFVTMRVGDANGDGEINVGDAVFMINHVFKGGDAPNPPEAGDANCDGSLNVGDAVYLINHVFKGGPVPSCP